MTRPRRPVVKSTRPARAAKMVSSLPRPAPSPGLNLVPRWRTMISPPVTTWPAKTFTPRRCAWESRPLRLEPSPFLLAILGLLVLGLLLRGGARGAARQHLDLADLEPGQLRAVAHRALVAALGLE